MELTHRQKIGQMLLAGFPSQEADEQVRRLTQELSVGNYILFADNLRNARQASELCRSLVHLAEEETGVPPLIAADQEGGIVSRLNEGAALLPGAMALAAGSTEKQVRETGLRCGKILRAVGINVNLAPVLDVNLDPDNPVIGVRAYGDEPERVAAFGCAMMNGLLDGGVLPVVKHFPGHGCVNQDSHLSLPVDRSPRSRLLEQEVLPFRRAIEQGAPAVMCSHVLYPALDEESPASLSHKVLTELLRETLEFSGLIFSDCLEMRAVRDRWGVGESAVRAIEAGCDILCISHSAEAVAEAVSAIGQALDSGRLTEERIDLSCERILEAKRRLDRCSGPYAHTAAAEAAVSDLEAIRENRLAACRSITRVQDHGAIRVLQHSRSTLVLAPDRKAACGRLSFSALAGSQLNADVVDLPMDPDPAHIADAALRARRYEAVVLGLHNAHAHPGQQALLRAMLPFSEKLTVVLLGSPYDAPLAKDAGAVIAAYEYTELSAEAAAGALRSGRFEGKLPVSLP